MLLCHLQRVIFLGLSLFAKVAFFDDFDLFGVIWCKIAVENIVHPEVGVNIGQLFDELPYKIQLAFPVDETKEVAGDAFFFP